MATNQDHVHEEEEEDEQYIDLEVREFEFQMGSISCDERDSITSPADELFYKGKLLPLHLPPRLQMVQKLLQNSPINNMDEGFEGVSVISPAESCRASSDLNPDEFLLFSTTDGPADCSSMGIGTSDLMQNNPDGHFFDWCQHQQHHARKCPSWHRKLERIKQSQLGQKIRASSEPNPDEFLLFNTTAGPAGMRIRTSDLMQNNNNNNPDGHFFDWCQQHQQHQARKCPSWQRKLERIKQSELGQKIRASRAYLRSLFTKPACSDDSFPMGKRNNTREIHTVEEGGNAAQRRSFSGAIKWHSSSTTSSASSSSSSFSFTSSNGYYDLHLLKRSNSANSELESSIEGAIAHCKQSSSSCLVQQRLVVK